MKILRSHGFSTPPHVRIKKPRKIATDKVKVTAKTRKLQKEFMKKWFN